MESLKYLSRLNHPCPAGGVTAIDFPSLTPSSPCIVAFMATAARALGVTSLPGPKDIFAFGDENRKVTASLNALALAGKKTATTSFPVPEPQYWQVGDLSVGLDEHDQPCFLMRTTELVPKKFEDVDAAFAADEGEGDLSLEYYLYCHRDWYKDKGFEDGLGKMVLCERFEIIYPIGVPKKEQK